MGDVDVPLEALSVSSLCALLEEYEAEVSQLTSAKEAAQVAAPFRSDASAEAELQALQRLVSHFPILEFVSCSNSPFFSAEVVRAPPQQKLSYAKRLVQTITQPTYGRYMKVLMLLLREVRFAILLCDAQFFARHMPHPIAPNEASFAVASAVGEHTVARLADAFRRIGTRRYYNAAQLLSQRAALAKNKTSPFSKALSDSFAELQGWIRKVCDAHILLRDPRRISAIQKEWKNPTCDLADAILEVKAMPSHTIMSVLRSVSDRVTACAEKHRQAAVGTDVAYFCGRVREAVAAACSKLEYAEKRGEAPTAVVQPAVMLQLISTGGGVGIVDAALLRFMDVIERMDELSPEMAAMNFLLQLYGVEAAETLAHDVDVVDGNFKRLIGDVFEDQTFDAEQQILSQQVLIPHCCDVTGCSKATARAWVLACLRAPPTEWSSSSADTAKNLDLSAWTGVANASAPPPPHYRLARNVQYQWKTADTACQPAVFGELDGVVYDARARQVLFVLEAKHNIADLGKACKQKERLFKCLDQAWASRAVPVESAFAAAKTTEGDDGRVVHAAVDALVAAPSTDAVSTAVVELQFFVAASAAVSEKTGSAVSDGETPKEGCGHDLLYPTSTATAAASTPPKVRTVCFTQANFTEHFRASGAAGVVAGPTREARFVYLSSLHAKTVESLDSTAPAPGGQMYLVEAALVSAIGDALSNGYQTFCQSGRLPSKPCADLKRLFLDMQQCSFYMHCVWNRLGDAGVARVPIFHLALSFPPAATVRPPASVDALTPSTDPYEYALSLWKHRAEVEDGSAAIRHVKLRSGFLNELSITNHSLMRAIESVARRHGTLGKATPSFEAVVKSLMNKHSIRNLIIVTDDEAP